MTMTPNQRDAAPANQYPKFAISQERAALVNAALPRMITDRFGYIDRQALEEPPAPDADMQPYIDTIAQRSSKEPDYLLPDTPLKEALFRVLLANGNRPMTPHEISAALTDLWAMSAYPRDLSPRIINRLLEHSGNYCIVPIPDDPDPDSDPTNGGQA